MEPCPLKISVNLSLPMPLGFPPPAGSGPGSKLPVRVLLKATKGPPEVPLVPSLTSDTARRDAPPSELWGSGPCGATAATTDGTAAAAAGPAVAGAAAGALAAAGVLPVEGCLLRGGLAVLGPGVAACGVAASVFQYLRGWAQRDRREAGFQLLEQA